MLSVDFSHLGSTTLGTTASKAAAFWTTSPQQKERQITKTATDGEMWFIDVYNVRPPR